MVMSPNASSGSESIKRGLKPASTYLTTGCLSSFILYCGAYDGTSGGTDIYRRIGSATFLNTGAATWPPVCRPTGSSIMTMIATTGFDAGANPVNDATNFVFE